MEGCALCTPASCGRLGTPAACCSAWPAYGQQVLQLICQRCGLAAPRCRRGSASLKARALGRSTRRRYVNTTGSEVRVVSGLRGVDASAVDPDKGFWGPMIGALRGAGYQPDVDIYGAPYDWRLAPADGLTQVRRPGLAALVLLLAVCACGACRRLGRFYGPARPASAVPAPARLRSGAAAGRSVRQRGGDGRRQRRSARRFAKLRAALARVLSCRREMSAGCMTDPRQRLPQRARPGTAARGRCTTSRACSRRWRPRWRAPAACRPRWCATRWAPWSRTSS